MIQYFVSTDTFEEYISFYRGLHDTEKTDGMNINVGSISATQQQRRLTLYSMALKSSCKEPLLC